MFNSILASSHHFYLIYFESEQIRTINDIISLVPENKQFETILAESQSYIHLQIEIGKAYGAESLLHANVSRKEGDIIFYWYDFYLGSVKIDGKDAYFICYLYSKLGKYLDLVFNQKMIKKTLFKSNVTAILSYIEQRLTTGYELEAKNDLLVSITKYTAQVSEDKGSNKMNIIGSNPLGSKVFKILSKDKDIEIKPISLKLKFNQLGYFVQLAVDKLGNFRFWLYNGGQVKLVPILPLIIIFFSDIDSVERSSFVNTNTLLEDDKEK